MRQMSGWICGVAGGEPHGPALGFVGGTGSGDAGILWEAGHALHSAVS